MAALILYTRAAEYKDQSIWENVEVNGVIFIWYYIENASPYWWLKHEETITKYQLQYQGCNEFYINCHIQDIPENDADWAHIGNVYGPAMLPTSRFSRLRHHSWDNIIWSKKSDMYQSDTTDESLPEQGKN
ncbi:hypothetical protein TSAR_002318 [Trichomalopsis sarcophagae]|uniref:Uncharacterized protein n=1 Tax=Trichomalopsis sarcophagae TaxID=543379 RepID=A0A232EUW5_9HYME|nr:hypothetical protein TSAR_002318 [Trichomalopsis sarcophagae]